MNTALLIIDPQIDFHDTNPVGKNRPALPVTGACEDSKRLANFIRRNKALINSVFVTLDTHDAYDIGHPAFWQDAEGNEVAPFTEISEADILAGRFTPVDPEMREHALDYARALEAAGRFKIMVWTTHCILDSWGYQIFEPIRQAMEIWTASQGKEIFVKQKGTNPLTEHYGAFAAEYVIPSDPATRMDIELLNKLAENDAILVGGQALSHCVGESLRQMVQFYPESIRRKIVLLRDTTSAVPGFEEFAENMVKELEASGITVTTTTEYEAQLQAA